MAFYEIYNEPAALEWGGGSWAFTDWKAHADELVGLVRSYAPDTIPLVSGLEFSYDFSDGGDTPFESADIALSVHPCPGRARTDRREAWDRAFGYLSDRYPIVFTEVGFDPFDEEPVFQGDLDYGRETMGYAREKHISWTAFVFYLDPYWPMPLFSDWEDLTPTLSGYFFKDLLAGEDLEVAGDGYVPETSESPSGTGPGGYSWGCWADSGATAEWLAPPSAESVAVHIDADSEVQAGMYATFASDGSAVDMSGYNEVVFDAAIAEGHSRSARAGLVRSHELLRHAGGQCELLQRLEHVAEQRRHSDRRRRVPDEPGPPAAHRWPDRHPGLLRLKRGVGALPRRAALRCTTLRMRAGC